MSGDIRSTHSNNCSTASTEPHGILKVAEVLADTRATLNIRLQLMSEISKISTIREDIVPVIPVQAAAVIHDAQTQGMNTAQTLLATKMAISRLAAMPIVTATMISQALENLSGELPQIPQLATPLLIILQKIQEQTTSVLDRSLMLAVRPSSPDNPSLFIALREFISQTAGLPLAQNARAAATEMLTLIESQLVINLHALTAGLPMRVFVPMYRNGKYEIAEFSYEAQGENSRRLNHFRLKLRTQTLGDLTVSGAELDKRLQIAFHTATPESAKKLQDNFPHLREKLERKEYSIMGLTAGVGKPADKQNLPTSGASSISIST